MKSIRFFVSYTRFFVESIDYRVSGWRFEDSPTREFVEASGAGVGGWRVCGAGARGGMKESCGYSARNAYTSRVR